MTLRLLLAIWVGSPLTAAWMIPLPMTLSRERRHGTFSKANNIFDDEDCADLCEFDDIFEDTVSAEANNNSSGNEDTKIKSQEEPASEVDRDRLRLQMNWELRQTQEDCDVDDVSSCGSLCNECMGSGATKCRFCVGNKHVVLPERGQKLVCPVCDQSGHEVCRKCRGSGWVAKWTELAKFQP
mmetsp:Transcript_8603/g.12459  ORF Transcript_8603/g.12459 Transcript_8603/m.12459 type:complete len:183 (-) Transcript_8603:96-644(-)